jgi:hypothetical protein
MNNRSPVPVYRALPGAHTVLAARDFAILEWQLPTDQPLAHRIGVIYDLDRDERPIDAVVALGYRDPKARMSIVALSESKGVLTAYVGGAQDLDRLHASIASAADVALLPDRWTVAPLQIVPVRNGVLDHARLPIGHPLLVLPKRYALGLVNPHE